MVASIQMAPKEMKTSAQWSSLESNSNIKGHLKNQCARFFSLLHQFIILERSKKFAEDIVELALLFLESRKKWLTWSFCRLGKFDLWKLQWIVVKGLSEINTKSLMRECYKLVIQLKMAEISVIRGKVLNTIKVKLKKLMGFYIGDIRETKLWEYF